MAAKNALRTTQKKFSMEDGVTAIQQVLDHVFTTLQEGTATEIKIQDDRGGQGTINVYVTQPRG
jgi:uncharacterized protein YqgV (UPF0045/DUF77 family)